MTEKPILDNLLWIEDILPEGFESTPKHGGLAYYVDMRLVMILVEQRLSTYEYKGVSYPFQIWNGCILPVESKKQSAFFLKFLFLENHPAHKDWLYIPAESENFEDEVKQFVREIKKGNPLLGLPVKTPKTPSDTSNQSANFKKKPKSSKTDKKKENSFLMGVLGRDKK